MKLLIFREITSNYSMGTIIKTAEIIKISCWNDQFLRLRDVKLVMKEMMYELQYLQSVTIYGRKFLRN